MHSPICRGMRRHGRHESCEARHSSRRAAEIERAARWQRNAAFTFGAPGRNAPPTRPGGRTRPPPLRASGLMRARHGRHETCYWVGMMVNETRAVALTTWKMTPDCLVARQERSQACSAGSFRSAMGLPAGAVAAATMRGWKPDFAETTGRIIARGAPHGGRRPRDPGLVSIRFAAADLRECPPGPNHDRRRYIRRNQGIIPVQGGTRAGRGAARGPVRGCGRQVRADRWWRPRPARHISRIAQGLH